MEKPTTNTMILKMNVCFGVESTVYLLASSKLVYP